MLQPYSHSSIAHWHRGADMKLKCSVMRKWASGCTATYQIFIPHNIVACPCIVILCWNPHSHPPSAPVKTPPALRGLFWFIIRAKVETCRRYTPPNFSWYSICWGPSPSTFLGSSPYGPQCDTFWLASILCEHRPRAAANRWYACRLLSMWNWIWWYILFHLFQHWKCW